MGENITPRSSIEKLPTKSPLHEGDASANTAERKGDSGGEPSSGIAADAACNAGKDKSADRALKSERAK